MALPRLSEAQPGGFTTYDIQQLCGVSRMVAQTRLSVRVASGHLTSQLVRGVKPNGDRFPIRLYHLVDPKADIRKLLLPQQGRRI